MTDRLAARCRRFAGNEAHGHSPLYEAFAYGVAEDPTVMTFLAALPEDKQQPNLLFAAVRHVAGTALDWPACRAGLDLNPIDVRNDAQCAMPSAPGWRRWSGQTNRVASPDCVLPWRSRGRIRRRHPDRAARPAVRS